MQDRQEHNPDEQGRIHLQSDCERCFGLCCVALPLLPLPILPSTKTAGPLPPSAIRLPMRRAHQPAAARHEGCTVYECFGAGQMVSQITYNGRDWRQAPETAKEMFDVFPIMRQLHELLWYLNEALSLQPAHDIHPDLRSSLEATRRLTQRPPASLLRLDVAAHRAEVNQLLLRTSELVRDDARQKHKGPPVRQKIGAAVPTL